jgi:hypothetical protein
MDLGQNTLAGPLLHTTPVRRSKHQAKYKHQNGTGTGKVVILKVICWSIKLTLII